jgi:seryl-tRNA synthetase
MTARVATDDTGLAILNPEQSALLRELDRVFTSWAFDTGAGEIIPPPVYPVDDLAGLDVYQNFPHLASGSFATSALRPARLGLSSATCYGAYLYFRDAAVAANTTVTLVNRCFRNEERYQGLRRLLSFQMREIVALGSYEHTQQHLAAFTAKIQDFARAVSLDLHLEAASDPFFQAGGARALLAKLSPVKYEFQAGTLAIASVNTHRNFFGERCGIRVAGTDETAFTSCVAFGLERWVSALTEAHDGDTAAALDRVRAAAGALA